MKTILLLLAAQFSFAAPAFSQDLKLDRTDKIFLIYTEFVRQAAQYDGHLRRDDENFHGNPGFLPPAEIRVDGAGKHILARGLRGLYLIAVDEAVAKKDIPYFSISSQHLSGIVKRETRGEYDSATVALLENGNLQFMPSAAGGWGKVGPKFELPITKVIAEARKTSTYAELAAFAKKNEARLREVFEKIFGINPLHVAQYNRNNVEKFFYKDARPDRLQEFANQQDEIITALNRLGFDAGNAAQPQLRARLAAKQALERSDICERQLLLRR